MPRAASHPWTFANLPGLARSSSGTAMSIVATNAASETAGSGSVRGLRPPPVSAQMK
jgi:hypothetical protein